MDLGNKKLIVYIGAGILILIVLGFLAYNYFPGGTGSIPADKEVRVGGRLPPSEGSITPNEGPQGFRALKPGESFSVTPEQTLTRLTDFPVVSPALNKEENKILFYKKDGGDLLASDFTGQNQEKISNLTVVGMIEAKWSPTRDRAAVFYLDEDTLKGFLHIGTSSVAVLPQDIQSFSWSPDGKSLAYLLPQEDRLQLITAEAGGKNQKTIFTTPIRDAKIQWASPDIIYFLTPPSGFAEGYIFKFSRSSGVFSKMVGPAFGLWGVWSPDGKLLLTSEVSGRGKNPKIVIKDAEGKEIFVPKVATLADKCRFADSRELWCAVPRFLAEDAVWPDDYLRGELNTIDSLVVIDLEKKGVRTIFDSGEFDMSDLLLTKDKNYLFFVNRVDGTLWSLKLR